MKNRISQWVSRGALATMAMLAISACTDDHFDIKNTIGSDKTLWETIESNPNLSDFAGILKRTKVLSNENAAAMLDVLGDILGARVEKPQI